MGLLRRKGFWIAIVLCALIAAGLYWRRHRASKGPPENEPALAEVSRGSLELRFSETGEAAARQSVDIASKVSGRVLSLGVQEGTRVAAGEPLAVIQPGRSESEKYLPSTVSSPLSGVVMRWVKENSGGGASESNFAKVGDYVTGIFDSNNPTYLMTVADPRDMIVRMKISEMDILKLKDKMAVSVTVDALPGPAFSARIRLISPQAERDSGGLKVFRVEVGLDRPDPRLRPGMTARVDALLEKRDKALKMPLAALFEEAGESFVYLQETPEKSREAAVRTGLRTELEVELLDGLKEGDKVFTEKPKDAADPAKDAPGKPTGSGRRAVRRMLMSR